MDKLQFVINKNFNQTLVFIRNYTICDVEFLIFSSDWNSYILDAIRQMRIWIISGGL